MTTTNTLFAKTIERIDHSQADINAKFSLGSLTSVGTGTRKLGINAFGKAEWDAQVLEAERFVTAIIKGRRGTHQFAEAMSTDLFPMLFADSLDRQLYGAYEAAPTMWDRYARRGTVNDFRAVKRFANTGIRGRLKKVEELAEHERRSMKELEYSVDKFEAGFGLSFEMMVNDDLGMFERLATDLAQSARDSEELFVTEMFVGPSGPLASVYNTGNDNVIASNAPLTRDALQGAITRLLARKDDNGMPIVVKAVKLVVGTGLLLKAQEIVNATEYRIVDPISKNITIISGNGIAQNFEVVPNYFLGTVASTANADTSWFLFADAQTTARPALEIGFLRGYEQPALYEKIPDMRRIGGGAEVPWSYEHGSSEKKVQHIFGGSFVDARMTLASNGTGTP
jgi:hypothetical protein